MKVGRLAVGSLLLVVYAASVCSAKEWRGIVPLKSTRADVERLLGPQPETDSGKYDLPDAEVFVYYAKFPCGHVPPEGWPVPPPGWNVPAGTVVGIRVALKKPVPLASLNFDLRKFTKARGDHDVPQHFHYYDEAEGFSIEVFDHRGGEGEYVQAYGYGPRAEDEGLRCPAPAAEKRPGN